MPVRAAFWPNSGQAAAGPAVPVAPSVCSAIGPGVSAAGLPPPPPLLLPPLPLPLHAASAQAAATARPGISFPADRARMRTSVPLTPR